MTAYSPQEIAGVVSGLLSSQLVSPSTPSFYLWARQDRAIISVNPRNLKNIDAVLAEKFRHALSTSLGGVRVIKTNSMGIFFQVGYKPSPPARLVSLPLDLTQQPDSLSVPIGMTASGPIWISIADLASVLIGGARGMGKTRLLHGWIQALVAGGACDLILYDGKDGLEFARYADEDGVTYTSDLAAEIQRLTALTFERGRQMQALRATDLDGYNRLVPASERLRPVVLLIDEAALITGEDAESLARLVAISRAHGVIPVLATQRTGAAEVTPLTKTNLVTRIALAVPAVQDSMVILGRAGAEKLPNTPGRLLVTWNARLVEAQAFETRLPGMPEITADEISLAEWSIVNHNGRMSIPLLVRERGMAEREARELLDVWQARGWIDGRGQGVARRVSPALQGIICQSVEVSQSCQSCQSGVSAETEE